jgi:hypothetical protein
VISLAEDVRGIAGWPAVEWGMIEEEVREALEGRVTAITPAAKFASSYAPTKAVVTIEGEPLEMVPQFSYATGELCQVLFRAVDAEAERIRRLSDLLTACYGPPVARAAKRTWLGPADAVELDTVRGAAAGEQLRLRWYPLSEIEAEPAATRVADAGRER